MSSSIIQRAEAEALAKQRVTAPLQDLPKDSKLKVVGDICSFHVFVAQLESYLNIKHWNSVMESWVTHQFAANSVAARSYSLMLQSMAPREFNGDFRYFADISEFKQALYDKFFFSKPIHIVVPEAIRKLHVGNGVNGLPTLLALSNQAKELYSLLPSGPTEEAQVELVKNLLPSWVQRELISSQSHMGRWITNFEDLDRCLALYDEEYARKRQAANGGAGNSFATRKPSTRPPLKHNKYIRHSKPHQNQGFVPSKPATPVKKPAYTGICDGCGGKGHSILKCFKTPQYAKDKWIEKVKANKEKKFQASKSFQKAKPANDASVNALINALVTKLNTATSSDSPDNIGPNNTN